MNDSEIVNFDDAVYATYADAEVSARHPEGMNAGEILTEVRVKFGPGAWPLCTVIDVADAMQKKYGRP